MYWRVAKRGGGGGGVKGAYLSTSGLPKAGTASVSL
jgi:hypothetical protein